jgi:hypothetical protein
MGGRCEPCAWRLAVMVRAAGDGCRLERRMSAPAKREQREDR